MYKPGASNPISYIEVVVTDKKSLTMSYQYVKFPGEEDHLFLSAFSQITQKIHETYKKANITINITNKGIVDYDWDLNGDGIIYRADGSEQTALQQELIRLGDMGNYFTNISGKNA